MTTAAAPPLRKPRMSREAQKAERSQALLIAAWEVFCEKGYESVTIDDVAERAGYSRMPVYSLFGDKQNLYFELWSNAVAELTRLLIGGFKPGTPLRRTLKQLAETIAQNARGDPGTQPGEKLFFVVQTIALSRPDIAAKLEQLARKVVADFAQIIRDSSLAAGERLRGDAETISAHLVAHINGLAAVQFQTRSQYAHTRDLTAIFTAIALKSKDE